MDNLRKVVFLDDLLDAIETYVCDFRSDKLMPLEISKL